MSDSNNNNSKDQDQNIIKEHQFSVSEGKAHIGENVFSDNHNVTSNKHISKGGRHGQKFLTKNRFENKKDSQFKESLLSVNRVTKVVEGGRIFSFSACVVVGNKAGTVGFAKGKASEALDAKAKGIAKAKKSLIRILMYKSRTIHHDVLGRNGSTIVLLRKAKPGKGIIAGAIARSVLSVCGIKDIVVKAHGSNNVYTTVRAIFDALSKIHTPKNIARKRDKNISDIFINK